MKQRLFFLSLLLLSSLLQGCIENSPWQTDLPDELKNLNAKNAVKLSNRNIPGDTFKVVFIGDTQRNPFATRDLIELINKRPDANEIAFIAILGDITDAGYKKEFELIYEALKKGQIPYFGVIGNHDGLSKGKDIFKEMFGPYDYVIRYKSAKFVAYNNNGYEFGKTVPDVNFLFEQSQINNPDETFSHYMLLGHTVFLERPDTTPELASDLASEIADFKVMTRNLGYKYGSFGHVHKFSFFKEDDGTYMTVDKVEQDTLSFALLTINPTKIKYEFCSPNCQPAENFR